MRRLAAAAVFILLVGGLAALAAVWRPQTPAEPSPSAEPVAAVEPAPATKHPVGPARMVAPTVVAPPELEPEELEWAEPRGPLSELALALPPKPVPPDKWDGTLLKRATAVASGRFEAAGYQVAIAGTESVAPDELCEHDGKQWACGMRARSAVRQWLRGRALSCVLPPEADRAAIVTSCRLGKQDVGAWLVSMGWARAVPGGRYAEIEAKARADRKGVFGPPPDTTLPPPAELTPSRELELGDGIETIMPSETRLPSAPATEGDPI